MKIYLIWKEWRNDGTSDVAGFCQTEDAAYKMCDKLKSMTKQCSYWVEELEELT